VGGAPWGVGRPCVASLFRFGAILAGGSACAGSRGALVFVAASAVAERVPLVFVCLPAFVRSEAVCALGGDACRVFAVILLGGCRGLLFPESVVGSLLVRVVTGWLVVAPRPCSFWQFSCVGRIHGAGVRESVGVCVSGPGLFSGGALGRGA